MADVVINVGAVSAITAGTGLTGGTVTGTGTIAANFGTAAGTICEGNDARLTAPVAPLAHASTHTAAGSDPLTLSQSQITSLSTDLAAKVATSRQVIAGTGMGGGGALSADVTLNVSYGTSGTTACVGNDARLSNARTPSTHASTHSAGQSDAITITQAQVTSLVSDLALKSSTTHAATHATGGTDVLTLGQAQITGLVSSLAAKALGATTMTAGTGLTGGGDLSANRSFAVAYGSTSTTATVGNDSRLSFIAAGVGATTRTLQNKLRDTVSVKDFGATGDGTTDDTVAIQAALNSGAANVLLPKGVYIITAPLVVPIKTTFRGESGGQYSDGSVIKKTTTTSGTGSNLCTTAPGGADSYVKNAILILPHPDNVSNYDTCIEDMRLESDGFIVEYGIYAPRTASLVLKNVAIFQCKYGYYTRDSWLTVFDHVNVFGNSIETQLAAAMGLPSAYGWASGSRGFWYEPDSGQGSGTSMDARNVCVRDVGTAWDVSGLNYSSMVACANDNISQCVYKFTSCVISTQGCGMENVFCGDNTGAIRIVGGKTSISGMSTYLIRGNSSAAPSGYIWVSDSAQLNIIGSNFVALTSAGATYNLQIGSNGNIIHDACTTMPSGGNTFISYGSGSSKVLIANPIQINDSVGTKYVKGRVTDNLVQEKQDKAILQAGTDIATFTIAQTWPSDFYAAELTITTVDATATPRSVCIAKYLVTMSWIDAIGFDRDITLVSSCISGSGSITVPVLSSTIASNVITLVLTPGAGEGDCVAKLITLQPTYADDVTAVLL
jgi:hypothetical protein